MAPLETKLVGVAGGFVFLAVLLVLGGRLSSSTRPTIQVLVLLTAGVLLASQVVTVRKIVARSRN